MNSEVLQKLYQVQKRKAKNRGIDFLMSFEEWLKIWVDSGKLEQRGRYDGYVMSRPGDKGPYAVGNVQIIPFTENTRQVMLGKKRSKEWCENQRRIMTGKKLPPHTEEAKQKMRLAALRRYANAKKRVV